MLDLKKNDENMIIASAIGLKWQRWVWPMIMLSLCVRCHLPSSVNFYISIFFSQGIARRVSECLLLNSNAAIFQVYHGENMFIFNEMMNRKKQLKIGNPSQKQEVHCANWECYVVFYVYVCGVFIFQPILNIFSEKAEHI
jgi:hypothetical protein